MASYGHYVLWRNHKGQAIQHKQRKEMLMKNENVPVSAAQMDELRICVLRSFDKLRDRLDSKTTQRWIGNSEALDRLMWYLLPEPTTARRRIVPATKRTLAVWRTFKVGGIGAEDLAHQVAMAFNVGREARYMMGQPVFVTGPKTNCSFVILTLAEFGFLGQPMTEQWVNDEFLSKWSANHLDGQSVELCTPEDGPQIRSQYKNQLRNTDFWVGMKPIAGPDGSPHFFRLLETPDTGEGPRSRLDGVSRHPKDHWRLDDEVIFRLKKV